MLHHIPSSTSRVISRNQTGPDGNGTAPSFWSSYGWYIVAGGVAAAAVAVAVVVLVAKRR